MIRFDLSRGKQGNAARIRNGDAGAQNAPASTSPSEPAPGEVIFEIGLVLMTHLALAAVVVIALNVLGAS